MSVSEKPMRQASPHEFIQFGDEKRHVSFPSFGYRAPTFKIPKLPDTTEEENRKARNARRRAAQHKKRKGVNQYHKNQLKKQKKEEEQKRTKKNRRRAAHREKRNGFVQYDRNSAKK